VGFVARNCSELLSPKEVASPTTAAAQSLKYCLSLLIIRLKVVMVNTFWYVALYVFVRHRVCFVVLGEDYI
jgi:hypothetical protein